MKIGKVDIGLWNNLANGERLYNDAANNERMIEVPLALWFCHNHNNMIEVGAVTPYYFKTFHPIYDPLDEYATDKISAASINYDGKTLLSISTVEHIGRGDYGLPKSDGLSLCILKFMMQAKTYLITFPRGYTEDVDMFAEAMPDNVLKFKRTENRKWEKVNSIIDVNYGFPFSCGNGLYVITNCVELLEG
jgi:hypothetical protein